MKKRSLEEKFSNTFEKLCKEILEDLFKNVNMIIEKTRFKKDGGIDIKIKIIVNKVPHYILAECKLRKGNLNLRDISANVIIAYNEGATALLSLSNHNITHQLEEEIYKFTHKSSIIVKFFLSEQFNEYFTKNEEIIKKYPATLIDLIHTKKSNNLYNYPILHIDLNHNPFYTQLIEKREKNINKDIIYPDPYLSFKNDFVDNFSEHTIYSIEGSKNIGKTTLIKNIILELNKTEIRIDGIKEQTEVEFITNILLQMWEIDSLNFFSELTSENLEDIISSIDINCDKKTLYFIFNYLFGNSKDFDFYHFNHYMCDYIISLLVLHNDEKNYILYFTNIQLMSKEVLSLSQYLITKISNTCISCIIEYDQSFEYQDLSKIIPANLLSFISRNFIEDLSNEQKEDFLYKFIPHLPKNYAKNIARNNSTLGLYVILLKISKKQLDAYSYENLKKIQILSSFDEILQLTTNNYYILFQLIYLCHHKVPCFLIEYFNIDNSVIEYLLEHNFIVFSNDNIIDCDNSLYITAEKYIKRMRYNTKKFAEELIVCIEKNENYITQTIYTSYYLTRYEYALKKINRLLNKLYLEKQYTLAQSFIILAIDCCEHTNDFEKKNEYILSYLSIAVILKNLNTSTSINILDKLKSNMVYLSKSEYNLSKMYYDYYYGLNLFKKCDFVKAAQLYESYFNNFMIYNIKNDVLIKICIRYTLCIKEIYGNNSALTLFKLLLSKSNNSELKLYYLSHLGCLNFGQNPVNSVKYFTQIIKMYEDTKEITIIPYHQYVDLLMSFLLARDYNMCISYAEKVQNLLESHGIYDEIGRVYNIIGCAYLCKNYLEKAFYYVSKSVFILNDTKYRLYYWRSEINLFFISMMLKIENYQILHLKVLESYQEFIKMYTKKINMLKINEESFYHTREYLAILMYYIILKQTNDNYILTNDFDFDFVILNQINKHYDEFKSKKGQFYNSCPYMFDNFIYMVG